MIGQITGKLLQKSPTETVIEAGGIGYQVHIPVTTFDGLPEPGEQTTLYTHLHVREDALQLFGFGTKEDKSLFRMLITVSGVGPKLGQTVMSGLSHNDLVRAIRNGDAARLNKIPGVGKKTAERLIVELRDKLSDSRLAEANEAAGSDAALQAEALLALLTLGYSRSSAENALRYVSSVRNNETISIEELIKEALRKLSATGPND